MTNAELIKVLRKCGKQSPDRCWDCDYYDREPWYEAALVNDAADALEAAEKRIAELEKQIPKEGEWIMDGKYNRHCSRCNENVVWSFNYCPNCGARMKGEQE